MAPTFLDTPVLDKGTYYVNFFNGRQLSAEDLENERAAVRRHQQQLGIGVGSAIIDGLQVVPLKGTARLQITRGSAVNRQGQVLTLPEDVEIELRTEPPVSLAVPVSRDDAGLFGECGQPTVPTVVPEKNVFGVHVLLIGPSSGMRERVPRIGLADEGVAARCGFAWAVEGVQFTVQRVDPAAMQSLSDETRKRIPATIGDDVAALSRLRDLVAHGFLGTDDIARHYANILRRENKQSPMISYGEMDRLWTTIPRLICDVPLALLFWSKNGIEFVDLWSVRRPLTPRPLSQTSPVATSERRAAEGEATLFHFQEQLAWLADKNKGRVTDLEARNHFGYLPAAGIVPLPTTVGKGPAFEDLVKLKFFAGCTLRRPTFIAENAVEPLLRQSLAYLPINLMATDDRGNERPELVWIYVVRENVRENQRTRLDRCLVFASGHMPYAGHARCDVSWCDFSNYSSLRLGAPGA